MSPGAYLASESARSWPLLRVYGGRSCSSSLARDRLAVTTVAGPRRARPAWPRAGRRGDPLQQPVRLLSDGPRRSRPDRDGPFGPVPLTPVAHLDRAASAFADRTAFIGGDLRTRTARCASAASGSPAGCTRSASRPATSCRCWRRTRTSLLEAHFGVPMAGAVLNALNTRLERRRARLHRRARRGECAARRPRAAATSSIRSGPRCRGCVWSSPAGPTTSTSACSRDSPPLRIDVDDELALLALNYTSGTTGRPKGVMYNHRGAYLQSLAMMGQSGLGPGSVFLWTLPMFHCNGWCFPWAVTARRRHPPRVAGESSRNGSGTPSATTASPTSTPRRPC